MAQASSRLSNTHSYYALARAPYKYHYGLGHKMVFLGSLILWLKLLVGSGSESIHMFKQYDYFILFHFNHTKVWI